MRMIDPSYANIERKKNGENYPLYDLFLRIHLYTQLLDERMSICIIQLLTVVEVTTDRKETFFLLQLYNQP